MNFNCDEIKCISLVERTDKRELISKDMEKSGIQFTFFDAIRDKGNPSKGCFKSHIQVITNAYNNGVNRLMVFEDDVQPAITPSDEDIKEINDFLDSNDDWEIFFIECCPMILFTRVHRQKEYKNIYKGKFIGAGMYIMNRKAMAKYQGIEWGGKHKVIDRDLTVENKNAYARLPRLFKQRIIANDLYYGINFGGIKTPSVTKAPYSLRIREGLTDTKIWYARKINIPLIFVIIVGIFLLIVIVVSLYRKIKAPT